ncbi:hypothetical protein [Shinella sp.]|jgi:transcriptional regulator with XRE-family HTH domain|uniref:hypothetical protein n=1 Tax=Shinella sp. TaxID=1870904 RepID=UPI003F704F64
MTDSSIHAAPTDYRRKLGIRIALAVAQMESKQAAALAAGITSEQLNKWVRGQVKVPAEGLRALAHASGVDFSWLVTGEGPSKMRVPFNPHVEITTAPVDPKRPLDDWIMRRIAVVVVSVYDERRQAISPENVAVECALLYNELVRRVSDISDRDEIMAVLPQIRHLLIKRLEKASLEPGTGKASA